MNNKYSVACITLVRDKYKKNRCSLLDGVTACVVYTVDSKIRFEIESGRLISIRDSIRTQKTIRRSLIWTYLNDLLDGIKQAASDQL